MEPLTYTVSEVAELLGISRSKAYDLVAEGVLPIVPLAGRRKLVPRVALERLVGAPVLRLAHARHQHARHHANRRPHDNGDTPGGPRSAVAS
jgi:excisionase family DNA binding protein